MTQWTWYSAIFVLGYLIGWFAGVVNPPTKSTNNKYVRKCSNCRHFKRYNQDKGYCWHPTATTDKVGILDDHFCCGNYEITDALASEQVKDQLEHCLKE